MDYSKLSDEELVLAYKDVSKKIILKQTLQLALKVTANANFGALAQSGFLFFDTRLASAITDTGRFAIQYVANHVEKRMNEFFKTKDVKYTLYQDTDSIFFHLGTIVDKYYKDNSSVQIIDALDKLMEQKIRHFVDESTDNISLRQNFLNKTLFFKREKLCSSGFWLAPKKYALKVYDNEGVRYAEPDYAITGIEVVRSSTPEIARKSLKQCIIHIIDKNIEALKVDINNSRNQFMTVPVEEIAFPRGANNLLQYSSDTSIYSKACPIAVRGALLHNHYISVYNIEDKYQPIEEGAKIKFIYLKVPNTIKENVIAFDEKLPEEFGLHKYVDRELQFDKVFMTPLNGILDAVGWSLEEKSSLDDFFG